MSDLTKFYDIWKAAKTEIDWLNSKVTNVNSEKSIEFEEAMSHINKLIYSYKEVINSNAFLEIENNKLQIQLSSKDADIYILKRELEKKENIIKKMTI